MDDHLAAEVLNAEHFWDDQARTSGHDALRAGCRDTADENTCIDRVQRTLARRAMERIRRLRRLRGAAVLDYGCGSGRWAEFLRAYGCLYTGVDLSAGMLEIARREHPDIEFRKTNGLAVPYGSRSFDLVWSVAVVHHNPPDRQEKLVAEFVRVLHDGGFLVLLEGVGVGGRPSGPLYYPRTRSDWSALAQRHGLSLRWGCGGSYFALRWLAEMLGRIGAGGGAHAAQEAMDSGLAHSPRKAAWLRLAAGVDAVLCPCLVGCLPPPLQRRVIMVFEKRSAQELAATWVLASSVPPAGALSSRPGSPLGPGTEPARVAHARAGADPRRAGTQRCGAFRSSWAATPAAGGRCRATGRKISATRSTVRPHGAWVLAIASR
jgi:SAM-dependent methyltransferase